VLEKSKKFHTYSGTNESLFRLWLRLLHVMLDVILIRVKSKINLKIIEGVRINLLIPEISTLNLLFPV
jgi:hypothetical protein